MITADTITDAQIRALADHADFVKYDRDALHAATYALNMHSYADGEVRVLMVARADRTSRTPAP